MEVSNYLVSWFYNQFMGVTTYLYGGYNPFTKYHGHPSPDVFFPNATKMPGFCVKFAGGVPILVSESIIHLKFSRKKHRNLRRIKHESRKNHLGAKDLHWRINKKITLLN